MVSSLSLIVFKNNFCQVWMKNVFGVFLHLRKLLEVKFIYLDTPTWLRKSTLSSCGAHLEQKCFISCLCCAFLFFFLFFFNLNAYFLYKVIVLKILGPVPKLNKVLHSEAFFHCIPKKLGKVQHPATFILSVP